MKEKPAVVLVTNIAREMGEDAAGDMAGSISYYAVLSIFPLLLGVIALYGLFLPSEMVQNRILEFADQYLPASSRLVEENINGIIEFRGTLGLFSIAGLLWTGSAIFGAIGRVVNRAWDITIYRPFYIRKLRDLTVAAGTGLIFLVSMAVSYLPAINSFSDARILDTLTVIISKVVGFVFIFIMISLVYKFLPNAKVEWRDIWPGAVVAAILFEVARGVFVIYLENFGSYDMVYGSIAAVIILLFWIYLSAFIIILGAETASEYRKFKADLKQRQS